MRHGPGNNDFFLQEGARHGHDGWWGGPLSLLLFLLFVALLVFAAAWLVRRLAGQASAVSGVAPAVAGHDPAVAALRMRYAKGEVSRDEFQHAIADLTGQAEPVLAVGEPAEGSAPTAS